MPFYLSVTAHTPCGVFTGNLNKDPQPTATTLENVRNRLQTSGVQHMTLHSVSDAGIAQEITLTAGLLDRSALVYEIRPAPEPESQT